MKKLIAPIILFAITVILLPSCSNTSKLAFSKRHYRSGYYVDVPGKSHTVIAASDAKLSIHKIVPIEMIKPENHVAVNTAVPIIEKPVVIEKMRLPKKMEKNNFITMNSTTAYKNTFTQYTWGNSDISGSASDGSHDHGSVSVPFALIVLCAIFIPPLGVGLMYGINNYFWIDLILTLLFFFPGMIFAIIVVLM